MTPEERRTQEALRTFEILLLGAKIQLVAALLGIVAVVLRRCA